jgi:hypothetical protein
VSDGDRSRAVRLARKLIRVEEEVIPVLYVEDAGRAVACYGRLGFHKQWEHQFEEGFPWFVSVARGRVRLYRTRIGEMPEGGEVEVVAPGISHLFPSKRRVLFGVATVRRFGGRVLHLADPWCRSAVRWLEGDAQLLHAQAHSALYGSRGQLEPLRDLDLCEAGEVGELDHLALLVGQIV